jgi:putative FmdB family regulatory protein
MPVYEYRCKACGKSLEIEHGFNDARPTSCPACGGQLVRVFHPVGVVFKGSGFHKTDYSSSGVRKGAAADAGSSDASTDGSPTSKPATSSEPKPVSGEKKKIDPTPPSSASTT